MGNSATPIAAGTPIDKPTCVRWRIVFFLMVVSYMSWFNRSSITVAADLRIMKDYGISNTQMGMVYSGFFFVYAAMMIPGGWFTDRKGPTLALFAMEIGTSLFVALTGVLGWLPMPPTLQLLGASYSTLFLSLLLVRGAMGFFAAPMFPSSSRMVGSWIPLPGRSWANGLVTSAALLGIASTFPAFGALIDYFDWPLAFVFSGIVTAVLALVWLWYVRDDPSKHQGVNAAEWELIGRADPVASRSERITWSEIFAHRSLIMLTLSYAAVGYFQYLFFFWTHHYFDVVLKVGDEKSRYYTTIVYLAMAVGMASGGYLSDALQRLLGLRLGRSLVPVGGMLAAAGFLMLGLNTLDPSFIVLWFALALGSLGMAEGPFWSTSVELGGSKGATAAGVLNTGGNIGGQIAPVLTPWVESILPRSWDENDRWRMAIGIGALVAFLGAGLWLWIDPRDRIGSSTTKQALES